MEKNSILKFIQNIYIEPTNLCNLNCIMCGYVKEKKPKGFMDISTFSTILNQIKEIRDVPLGLHAFGEPLLHPEMDKFISLLKDFSFSNVFFATNATLLGRELAHKIVNSDIFRFILLGIDAFSAKTYSNIRKGNIMHAANGIKNLLIERQLAGKDFPKISVLFIYMDENKHELEIFYKVITSFFKKMKLNFKVTADVNDPDYLEKKHDYLLISRCDLMEKERVLKLNEGLKKFCKKYSILFPEVKEPPCCKSNKCFSVCSQIFNLTIHFNGWVSPCCCDSKLLLKMGNVKNNTLEEILCSEKFLKFRAAHINQNLENYPICQMCNVREKWPADKIKINLYKEIFYDRTINPD